MSGVSGAPGYSARRTLPLAVETVRQLRRRRTLIAFGLLLVLPWRLVGAFQLSGSGSAYPQTPGLGTIAPPGLLNLAALPFFSSSAFLPVAPLPPFLPF